MLVFAYLEKFDSVRVDSAECTEGLISPSLLVYFYIAFPPVPIPTTCQKIFKINLLG